MLGAKIKTTTELAGLNQPPQEVVDALMARYDIDFKWRAAWIKLSNKREAGGRLQVKQEAIERKAVLANNRIGALMRKFDAACT